MKKRIRIITLITFCFVILFVIGNSFIPGNSSKKISDFITKIIKINSDKVNSFYIRKFIGHFLLYSFMGFILLLNNVLGKKINNLLLHVIIYLIICFSISVISEVIQEFIPNRYCTIEDMIINLMGCLLPLIITLRFYIKIDNFYFF